MQYRCYHEPLYDSHYNKVVSDEQQTIVLADVPRRRRNGQGDQG